MVAKIDKTGEESINNFGSKIVIVNYRKYSDIDVYFPEYNWTFKNAHYSSFKKGNVKCPYEQRYYEIGYFGEGKYKVSENGKTTRYFNAWYNMLKRCYSEKYYNKNLTYTNCEVDEDWLNFQNFAKWYKENYYEIEGEQMELDKDILCKHNKIYSPETCIFVPHGINALFTKSDKTRGDSCIGTYHRKNYKYQAYCRMINPKTGKSKREHLGFYNTQEKAFEIYKYYKERNIKDVADYYKDVIPQKLYNALYEYEVEIND